MNPNDLKDRVALVTGGAKGIGRACCERLARAGIKVAINYRSSEADAQKTAQAVKDAGSLAHLVRADVSSTEEVHSMVSEISDTLGPIDILINNAGVLHSVGHEETTPEIWQQTLDINLTGTYNVTWAVKDGMIERKFGRIVNMSSIGGLSARPYCIAYSVSKAGVIALTRSLAQAVAAHNIRINAVAPGLIETEMIGGLGKERRQKLIEDTPISRLGTPAEIANLVYFLLSEESSFTTGQTVVASGGRDLLP